MPYVKAGLFALLGSLVLGAATGTWRALVLAVERLSPEDRQVVLSQSISEAMNNAALLVLVMVPVTLIVAYGLRRRRRQLKSAPPEGPGLP